MKPYPVDELAAELYEFVKKDDVYRISQFLNYKGITSEDYYTWVEKHLCMRNAHKHAMSTIADRREIGAITGKLKENAVMPYMAMYDKDFKKFMEWKASLTKRDEEKSETKIVVIERYPDTGIPAITKVGNTDKEQE
jgi:adenine deaminase